MDGIFWFLIVALIGGIALSCFLEKKFPKTWEVMNRRQNQVNGAIGKGLKFGAGKFFKR